MARRLRPEEVVTIQVLSEKQVSGRAIARQLGVTEGAVRYRLRRSRSRAVDRQVDRASRIGVSVRTVNEVVRGKRAIMSETACLLAAARRTMAASYSAVKRRRVARAKTSASRSTPLAGSVLAVDQVFFHWDSSFCPPHQTRGRRLSHPR